MKKTILSVALFVAVFVTACGPSAEEIEKKRQDSIATADSIAAVRAAEELEAQRIADSTANAEIAAQAMADSLAAAEAAKSAKKPAIKKPEPKVEEPKKIGDLSKGKNADEKISIMDKKKKNQ